MTQMKSGGGHWMGVVDLGRGSVGERKQLSRCIKGTRREAEAELARMLQEIDRGKTKGTITGRNSEA